MKWFEPLFVGESVKKKEKKIIRKIKKGSFLVKAHVICLASNPGDLFDIIDARELAQKAYPKDSLRIIGICGDRDEAIAMVTSILEQTIETQQNTDVRSYLKYIWRN